MLKLHKSIVLDEKKTPVAVQIPIDEFRLMEEAIENYGLAKLIQDAKKSKRLNKQAALRYYQSLKHGLED